MAAVATSRGAIEMAEIEGQTVHPKDVADERGVVRDTTFTLCRIHGPAVIHAVGCRFDACRFDFLDDIESILWEVPEGPRVGGFMFDRCAFNECVFIGIGFAGNREFLDTIKRAVGH
jgi:hypothetical protein